MPETRFIIELGMVCPFALSLNDLFNQCIGDIMTQNICQEGLPLLQNTSDVSQKYHAIRLAL